MGMPALLLSILLLPAGSWAAPPPAPSLLAAPGPHEVRISWSLLDLNAVSPVSRYLVYRSTGASGPYSLFKRIYAPIPTGFINGTTTVYVDATASPVFGHAYHYRVEIYDSAEETNSSTASAKPTWSSWHRFRGDAYLTGMSPAVIESDRLVEAWRQTVGTTFWVRGQAYHNGRLYTTATDGRLRNYAGYTGVPGTSVSPGSNPIYISPLVDPDGILYFASRNANWYTGLYAYRTGASPTPIAAYPFTVDASNGYEAVYMNLAFFGNSRLLVENNTGYLYGVDPKPQQDWVYYDAGAAVGAAVNLMNGNVCYMVSRANANVMCLDPDGKLVWTQTLSGSATTSIFAAPIALGPDGRIYAATNELAALRPEDGSVIWKHSLPAEAVTLSVGPSGEVYLTYGAQVRCVDSSGAEMWTTTVSGGVADLIAAPVVTSDNKLVVPYRNQIVPYKQGFHIFRRTNGALLFTWEKPLLYTSTLTPLVATPDGWFYLSADDSTYGFAVPPVVSLGKKADKALSVASDTLRYTISWSNSSVMTAVNLWIWDTLPNGTSYKGTSLETRTELGVTVDASYASSLAGPWTAGEPPDGTTLPLVMQWKVSSVGAYASGELSFAVTISSTLIDGNIIRNQASATNYFGSTTTFLSSSPVTTLIGPPPDPPTGLTVFIVGSRHIGLYWEKPAYEGAIGVAGYDVYRSVVSESGPFEKIGATLGSTATAFVDTPLTNGVACYYVVTAKDSMVPANESAYSDPAYGTPFEPPAAYIVAWVEKAPMRKPRWGHELQAFGDFIYAFGGDTGLGVTADMERLKVYGPAGWETLSYGGSFEARSFFGSVRHKDEFYAVGGDNGTLEIVSMQKFNPTTTGWSDVASSGFEAVSRFPMVSDPVSGFFTAFAGYKSPLYSDRIQWFAPALLTWVGTSWPAVMTPRRDASAAGAGLSMFMAGGEDSLGAAVDDNYEFILFKSELIRRSSLPGPRRGAAGAALDGRVYAIGGVSGSFLSDVMEYNPATGAWIPRAPLPVAIADARAVQGIRKIYLAGGRDAGGNPLGDVYEGTPLDTAEGENKIGLAWGFEEGTYPLAAAPFTLYRSTYVAMSLADRGSPLAIGVSATVFTDASVTNGNFYEYFVDAVDTKGNSIWVWDLVWLPTTAPLNLSALPGSNQIALSWDALPNADAENVLRYAVYRSTFPELGLMLPPEYQVGGTNPEETKYVDRWLTNGIKHYYVVRAVSRLTGAGRACATVMETPVYLAPPGVPENPMVSALPEQVVSLKWTSPPAGERPISGYRVYRSTGPSIDPSTEGSWIAVLKLPVASGSVYFEFLDQSASAAYGNAYSYAVTAVDDWVPPTESLPSSAVSVLPAGGYFKSARADPYGTGRSQLGAGLSTSLALRWAYDAGGAVMCSPVVDPNDGSVFFTSMAGKLHKVPADGGVGGWSVNVGPGTPFGTEASPALVFTEPAGTIALIYAAYSDGAAGGISAFTAGGGLAWFRAMPAPVRSSPMVLPDGGVIVGDDLGTVRVFSADGTLRWSRTIPGAVSGPIVLLEEGGGAPATAGVGCATGRLYGFRILDGTIVGHLGVNGAPTGLVYNPEREELYVSTLAGNIHVYGFLREDSPKVTFTLTAVGGGFVGALAFDRTTGVGAGTGTVIATNTNGNVYHFDVEDPAGTLGIEEVGSPSRSSAVFGSAQRVYWGDDNGRVWEARESSTTMINSVALPLPGAVGKASPGLWTDGLGRGVVYCGSESGLMCAFADAPHVPGPVSAVSLPEKVALSWTVSGAGYFPVSGYRVYRASCASCSFSVSATTWGQFATGYVDSGLEENFRYYYRVCAFDDSSYLNQSLATQIVSEVPSAAFFLSVEKTVFPAGEACTGSALVYTFSWSNTGSSTAYGITVTDTLPNGTLYKAPSLDFYAQGDGLGTPVLVESLYADASADPWTWTSGEPPDSSSSPLVLRWIVDRAAPGRTGWIRFAVGISSTLSDGDLVSNSASATVLSDSAVFTAAAAANTVRLPAVLDSSIHGPGAVSTGQVFGVTLSVTNTGTSDANLVAGGLAVGPGQALVNLVGGPTGSLTLAPGGSTVFEWVFSASSGGLAVFTASVTGVTCGSASLLSAAELSTTVVASASLSGALDFHAAQISVGQAVLVTLTVTNTGGAKADGVTAANFSTAGNGSIAFSSGPWPAMPVSLAGGEAVTFTWTYSGAVPGTVEFTTTITGADSNSGSVLSTGALSSGVLRIQTPASLSAAISPYASSVCQGEQLLVTVTVSNTGQAAADSFSLPAPLVSGAGGALYVSGPQPPLPLSLAGVSFLTFSYTYTGVSPGNIFLSTTATGTDANSGTAVSTGTVISPAVAVSVPGALSASVTSPALVSTGQQFPVVLAALNTGGSAVTGVVPSVAVGPGSGLVSLVSGPAPANVAVLAPADSAFFTWIYRADAAGVVTFSATASGVTCGATALGAWNTASLGVVNASSLEGRVDVYGTQITIGQNVTVTLTLTNVGDAVAFSVTVTMTPSNGSVTLVSGPAAGALSISGGAERTYTWVYLGNASGDVTFTANAKWADGNSGEASSVNVGPSSILAVLSPAALGGVLTLGFPGGNSAGDTVRAEFTVANTGQAAASVSAIAISVNESSPGVLGAVSVFAPATPVTVNGGSAVIFTWDYTAGICGTASVSATASGMDLLGALAVSTGPVLSGEVGIAAAPDLVVGRADPDRVKVGGLSELTFQVLDNCIPDRIPVSGVGVSMVVIAGGGTVSPAGGTTDSIGEIRTTLRLGASPGVNAVRADVFGAAANPGGTVYVEGAVPDAPAAYLSKNFFDPSRGERLQVRVSLPSGMHLAVRVYNMAGEAVRKLSDSQGEAGLTILEWDGRNDNGGLVGNGVYFVQIVSGKTVTTRRVIVLKR